MFFQLRLEGGAAVGLALQSPVVLAEVEVAHGKVYFRKINEQKPIYLSFFS